MNSPQSLASPQTIAPLRESDYEAIEAAVMETEKGRWFLAEYARRHRAADTDEVLGAIGRLEKLLKRERRPDADRIRLDIGEMKDAIERTKLEIAQIKHDAANRISKFDSASNELDAIVTQTEAATSEILSAAEKIQEIVWTMREDGIATPVCDTLEDLVMTMYTSCSFQDLTGQRTQKVVHVLRYLESRIDAMIRIWGMEDAEVATTARSSPDRGPVLDTRPDAHLLNGPQLAGQGIGQDHVDSLLDDLPAGDGPVFDNELSFDDIDVSGVEDAEPAPAAAVFDNNLSFDDIDVSEPEAEPAPVAAKDIADPAPEASAAEFSNDLSFEDLDVSEVLPEVEAADRATTDAGPSESAPERESAFDSDEAEAAAFLADATPTRRRPDTVEAMPAPDDVGSDDEFLAAAAEAMDAAIETLRDVSAAARGTPVADADDPFQFLTKAERQALLA